MAKTTLAQRIAAEALAEHSTRAKNRALFLAVREEVRQALELGWPVKRIWRTLAKEKRIPFGYDAFIGYVDRLILKPVSFRRLPTRTDDIQEDATAGDIVRSTSSTTSAHSRAAPMSSVASKGFDYDPTPNREDLF